MCGLYMLLHRERPSSHSVGGDGISLINTTTVALSGLFRTINALKKNPTLKVAARSLSVSGSIFRCAVGIKTVQLLAPNTNQSVPSAATVLQMLLGCSRMLFGACMFGHLLDVILVA